MLFSGHAVENGPADEVSAPRKIAERFIIRGKYVYNLYGLYVVGLTTMAQNIEVKVDEIKMKVIELEQRVKSLEALINARQAPDTAGHPNDGGWFD